MLINFLRFIFSHIASSAQWIELKVFVNLVKVSRAYNTKKMPPLRTSRGGAKFEPQIKNIWLLGYFKGTHIYSPPYLTSITLSLLKTKLTEKKQQIISLPFQI